MHELIERDAHLKALADYVEDARAGSGRLVLIAGEAGIGKSALIDRVTRSASVQVVTGQCDAIAPPRPLGPVLEIAAELGCDLDLPRDALFPRILRELRSAPAVLVIEDVHWADEATREFVLYLGRRIARLPVLALVSYRDDEAALEEPLRIMVGEASRLPAARRIDLPRFSRAGVGAIVEGSGLDAEEVHRLTGGNPYFVSEIVANGSLEPTSARDAILARAATLSRDGRNALDVASQLGARFDPALLLAAGASAEAVDECLARRLLEKFGDGIGFRHEIARAAIDAQIQAMRRIAIHRAIVRALGERGETDAATMAYHAAAAGDGPSVVRYGREAAREAARLGAHIEARRHLETVLRYAARVPDEERARLLDELSMECQLTDRMDEGVEARLEAIAIWERLGNMHGLGNGYRMLSRLYRYKAQGELSAQHLFKALEILEPLPAGPELARVYADISGHFMVADHYEQAVEFGRKAVELAERTGSQEVLAVAFNNVGTAIGQLGDHVEGIALLERSIEVARSGGWADHEARAYANLAGVCWTRHDLERCGRYVEQGISFAEERDLIAYGLCMLGARVDLEVIRGRWDEALRDAEQLRERSRTREINNLMGMTAEALISVRRGSEAARDLAARAFEVAQGTEELQFVGPAASVLAEEAWLRGDLEGVRDVVDPVWADMGKHGNAVDVGRIASWKLRAGSLGGPVARSMASPFDLQLAGRWGEAAEVWRELGAPYDMACALLETDDPAALTEAYEVFERLGARPAARLAAERLRGLGARVPRGPRTSTRANPAGLTDREAEILSCLAEGMTNPEIATSLFISEKTVEHHVSRVLAKLGTPTRRDAARRARDEGLVLQS